MSQTATIAAALAVLAYLVAAALLLHSAKSGRNPQGQPYRVPAVIAIVCHALSVYSLIWRDDAIYVGFFSALSLTSLLLSTALILMAIRQSIAILGVVIFPLSAVFLLCSVLLGDNSAALNPQLQWHILTSVMAYSVLALAVTQSIALALQTHYLRTLQTNPLVATLPPIDLMEKVLFQMIGLGFVLLSASLLTGFVFLEDVFAQHLVHKTTLTMFAWATFGILLAGRTLWGWRGRTAMRWTTSGFALLIVGYFGSKLVLEFILAK
ncbi:MAG: cytochrome c biogenesis protein CcsA [Pseudomonadota bacterium]